MYKDRIFTMLFGREEYKENTLALFNALNGTNYTDTKDLRFTTIDNSLYLGCKNDVSFIIDSEMSLYEQQSTINPNMPLRGLVYFGKIMDSYISVGRFDIYGKKLIKIPTPKYYVFYNGTQEYEPVVIQKLSDSFMTPAETADYEWTATVINLNDEHNKKLLDKCKPLAEYTELVKRLSAIKKGDKDDETAKENYIKDVNDVIDECIKENILSDFLIKLKAEVRGMILEEFDMQIYYDDLKEEGVEIGEERLGKLIILLTEAGRTDDVIKASTSKEAREELYKEFNV